MVFDRSWTTASELKVYLNSCPDNAYLFYLQAPRQPPPSSVLISFDDARKQGRSIQVTIGRYHARAWQVLTVQKVDAAILCAGCPADGSLRLEATRTDERLTFQVNRREPLEFRDQFPLNPVAPGSFGLYWPEGVSLQSLHGFNRPGPALASALESGNDLYNRGEYERALSDYQQVFRQSRDARVRQEARYKEAVCLLTLQTRW